MLLRKLHYYGKPGMALEWSESKLTVSKQIRNLSKTDQKSIKNVCLSRVELLTLMVM